MGILLLRSDGGELAQYCMCVRKVRLSTPLSVTPRPTHGRNNGSEGKKREGGRGPLARLGGMAGKEQGGRGIKKRKRASRMAQILAMRILTGQIIGDDRPGVVTLSAKVRVSESIDQICPCPNLD